MDILTSLGLSIPAGLNAYIPLLAVALAQRFDWLALRSPFDALGEWWMISVIAVLLVVEIIADKIPAVDHVNDIVQTFIRPAAGAIVAVAASGSASQVSPWLLVLAGVLLAGGVHVAKAVARPVVNASTAGIGAPVVSTAEDAGAVALSVTAIAAPQLLNRKKGTADSSAAPDMLFSAMDSGIKQAESAPEAPQVEMDGGGSSVEGALSGEQDDSSALTAGENIETGSEGSPRDPGQAAAPGSKNDSSPVEINGYTCSAIIVLDPEVSPPDVFDQYTYYSWQESHSLYLIISGDLYDELIDSLDNLKIDYNLELYSEITSDGWILLITSAQ